ncbi:MAG: CHAT domain-containing protein [Pseudomonadota bacterium]
MSHRQSRFLALAVVLGLSGCAEVASGPFTPQADEAVAGAERGSVLGLQREAYTANALMDFEEAESRYRESAIRSGDAFSRGGIAQLEQELYLALNKSNLGEFEPAEALFARSLREIERKGSLVSRVKARVFYAQHLLNQGRAADAIGEADGAVALGMPALTGTAPAEGQTMPFEDAFIIEAGGVEIPETTSRMLRGDGSGDLSGAVSTGRLSPTEQLRVLIAQSHYVAAAGALATTSDLDAPARLAEARMLLDEVPSGTALWLRAEIARLAADHALASGEIGVSVEESDRAVRIARRFGAGERPEALLRMQQGRIRLEAGDEPGAFSSYERALDILSRGGRGVSLDALSPYFGLLERNTPGPEAEKAAFRALQQLRNPVTSGTLARLAARLSAGDSAAAQAIRDLQDAERAVNREAALLDRLTAQPEQHVSAIRLTRARLAEAEAAQAAAQAAVASSAPNYAQIIDSSVTLEDFRARLRPGELFVQLRLGQTGGVVMGVTTDTIALRQIELTEPEAEALVDRVRESVYNPFFDVEAARALYVAIFGPIDEVVRNATSVVFAPDGPLLSIPAGLMISDEPTGYTGQSLDYSSVPWFGTESAVSVSLSLASFHHLRGAAPSAAARPFRGFGDFVPFGQAAVGLVRGRRDAPDVCDDVFGQLGQLSPLPGTAQEVRSLSQIAGASSDANLLGEQFTDAALRQTDLSDARVLHFATHGLLPISADCLPEPSLATSLGPDGDGLLEASEIVELALDADLVVLSACDTGGRGAGSALGTGFRGAGGEALSGLVRAFFYAGARNVVASHWLVPDAETVQLMERLYTGLASGESPSSAIRDARRSLAREPATSHPFYWAAFSVIGDAARQSRIAGLPQAARAHRIARGGVPTP